MAGLYAKPNTNYKGGKESNIASMTVGQSWKETRSFMEVSECLSGMRIKTDRT